MTEARSRIAELVRELDGEIAENGKQAKFQDYLSALCFWGSLVLGGLATALGLIPIFNMPAWVISLLAAGSSGTIIVSREARIQDRADWFYSVRDTAKSLRQRLLFEFPEQPTLDDVAAISKEWREEQDRLGNEMARINRKGAATSGQSRGD